MARRPQFRDEDMLEAARAVFLARGIRATTAQVAKRAGVSEGTLFHHFKTKEALFRAAVSPHLSEPQEFAVLPERVGRGEVRDNVLAFATAVMEWLRARVPMLLLAWAQADVRERKVLMCEADPLNARASKLLAGYLEAEARLGRLRSVDAEIAARALLGGVFDYVRGEVIDGGARGLPLPAGMYLRGLVDIFLHGISASGMPSSRRARRGARS